jgi:hemerythrin-like domain-containing protein
MTPPNTRPAAATLRTALEGEHHAIDDALADLVALRGGVAQATDRARSAIAALRRHVYLEDEMLFPPLREAGLLAPVLVMLSEHRELWRTMDDLEQRLDAGEPPARLVELARTLLAQLERHNAKEEPILYSQLDTVLSGEAQAAMSAFLADGRMPTGWRCDWA